jgi:hypothetical protein
MPLVREGVKGRFRTDFREWGTPMKSQAHRAACAWSLLTFGLQFLALAFAFLLPGSQPLLAASGDWTLVCPQGSSGEPFFRDPRGLTIHIINPGERAIATMLCGLTPPTATGNENYPVTLTNQGASTIYVAFTNYSTQQPGPITWTNCSVVNNQAVIPGGGTTCNAQVPTDAGITRFCASTTQVPAGQAPNCNQAQMHNQTIIETNFGAGGSQTCYPTTLSSCVWYDISVIPQNCTPAAWTQNNCQNTGGASYNLPVSLASAGQATITCQGPQSTTPYGNANYPSNCGNPTASCIGNTPSCDNAYFWPTPVPEPNVEGQNGQTLVITFLAGS